MKRKISSKKYLLAFVLTIAIFLGGFLFGLLIEDARVADSKQLILDEKVNLQSLQLQHKYIQHNSASCESLNKVLETNINELGKKMATVIDYEKNSLLNQKEFDVQLRDYFLTQIQFLLLSQEVDKQCGQDNVKIIYFFDENELDTQGKILDYIKKKFGSNVLVFSFNSQFSEEPMIPILLTQYNVSQFPAVVVGETVYQGHQPVEVIMKEICMQFKEAGKSPSACNSKEKFSSQ